MTAEPWYPIPPDDLYGWLDEGDPTDSPPGLTAGSLSSSAPADPVPATGALDIVRLADSNWCKRRTG